MARQAVFLVSLTKLSDKTITIDYTTQDGTAKAPGDYTPVSGTLTYSPGELVKSVNVPVRRDIPNNPAEAFSLVLSNPKNCALGVANGTATIPAGVKAAPNGPLIKNGLITNAYHNESGRGGYFHAFSGTSEGQSIGIEGSFLAYQVLREGTEAERAAAAWYKTNAQQMLDAMGTGSPTGPMLRQPIPDSVNTITLLHWLFAARGDIPAQAINYTFKAVPNGRKLTIPANVPSGDNGQIHKGGASVYRVWQVYPATSSLLYSSPYSPSFDITAPTADTSIVLDAQQLGDEGSIHWVRQGKTVVITLPESAPTVPEWFVVYGYNDAGTIKQGAGEEAFPNWTGIADSYSACAPDTFRWFEYAMSLAIQLDDRAGKSAQWQKLRDAMRRSAVRGQNVSDLREVFKPMPGYPAIPSSGEPTGMFCYSSNPAATAPPISVLEAGGNEGWLGYSYWSRIGDVSNLDTWTPAHAFDRIPNPTGSTLPIGTPVNPDEVVLFDWDSPEVKRIMNGAIKGSLPVAGPNKYVGYDYQIGRGFNDEWRNATDYQEADQFLLVVTMGTNRQWTMGWNDDRPSTNHRASEIEYFISTTKNYSETTRYVCKATKKVEATTHTRLWATMGDGSWQWLAPSAEQVVIMSPSFYRVNAATLSKQMLPENIVHPNGPTIENYAGRYYNQYNRSNFTGGLQLCYELIPIEAFQRMDKPYVYPDVTVRTATDGYLWPEFGHQPNPPSENVLPRGVRIENFGMTLRPGGVDGDSNNTPYLVAMRLVSGPSKEWVLNNLDEAIKGSRTPFFPGSMPFAINSDTAKQQFVGWNGSPFHGYQLADYWYALQADADAVHPGLNPTLDLPVARLDGVVEYPIAGQTAAGAAKPKHAMLAEQQLLFLKRAQEKWIADGGASGPFAHTFVVNTPARISLGNPTPHQWVYTNDDPNTRWIGYQTRVVESLARLIYIAGADAGWATAVELSLSMAMRWIERFNVLWPNLNGISYTDPKLGQLTLYGSPTDYDDPRTKGITTSYEEPHGPALILRACLWLNLSGKLTGAQAATVQAVGKRCWDYIELRYRKDEGDSMRYTWSNTDANTTESYFGFWQFEITATIAYLLKFPAGIPAGIDPELMRQRLVETQTWLVNHVE